MLPGGRHATEARLWHVGDALWLWFSQIGTGRTGAKRDPNAAGALGGGGSNRKGRPHSHRAHSRMGQISARSVDAGGQNHGGKDLSCGCQDGEGMGEWYLAKCGLVCGQDLLRESGLGAHCATRPATNLREVVPRQWW